MRSAISKCCLALLAAALCSALSAATFTVTNLNDAGAGSLRAQLAAAQASATTPPHTINFNAALNGTITLASELTYNTATAGRGVTIDGTVTGGVITVAGSATIRCFHVGNTAGAAWTFAVANLNIINGTGTGGTASGGGIRVVNAGITLTLNNVTVDNCDSTNGFSGGGVDLNPAAGVTCTNCRFTNCTAANTSGAVRINANMPATFTNCTFTGNVATGAGGAIGVFGNGAVTISSCTFSTNTAGGGGGGIQGSTGTLSISGSTFNGNTAGSQGGGVASGGSTGVTIADSTFSGNTATANQGGGASLFGTAAGTHSVRGSTFNGNNSGLGAGLSWINSGAGNSVLNVTNSTFSGNTDPGTVGGAAVLCACVSAGNTSTLNLIHCTITGNTSGAAAGTSVLAFTQAQATATAVITYRNTIISGAGTANIGDNGGPGTETLTSNNNNICSDATGNLTGAQDQPSTNPNLGALANNGGPTQTHMPNAGSPAIDKAQTTTPPTATDQRGTARPINDPLVTDASNGLGQDIGAVEAPILTAPEMDVFLAGTAVPVVDGTADARGNFTTGVSTPCDYTVENTGTANLTLTVPVTISNQMNCTVTETPNLLATIAPSANSDLLLNVTVTAAMAFSFDVSIANNDANENPYNWTVTGTGVAPAPEMDVSRAATPIVDGTTDTVTGGAAGTPMTLTYDIDNVGTANLNITTLPVAAPGTQTNCTASITTQPTSPVAAAGTTTMVVSVTPAAAGVFSCTISIDNNDANENPYDWTISGTATGPEPEMDVTRGATPIASGGTDTVTGGLVGVASVLTYTITNSGSANLTITTPVAAPGAQTNCTASISTQPTSPVTPTNTTTLGVTVTPAAAGIFSCTISITNNDTNENPYLWTISGTATVPAPEMDVSNGATPVVDGTTDALGSVPHSVAQTVTYTITNTGNAALNLTGSPSLVTVTAGTNVTSATLTTPPASSVAPSGTTTFTVTYTVTAAGAFDFAIDIPNNDADEGPYNWTAGGTGATVPEMDVTRGATLIVDGATDNVGTATTGSAASFTYTITNNGNTTLNITNPVAISGQTNCTATVGTPPAATVAAAANTTLVITVTPIAAGAFSFSVSIVNDDPNENPYDWTVTGTGTTGGGGGGGDGGDDEGCSTGEGNSWFLLAALVSALGVALRVRRRSA